MRERGPERGSVWLRWRGRLCAAVALVCLGLSVLAAASAHDLERIACEKAFALDAAERVVAVERSVEDAVDALAALSALYAASQEVTAAEFDEFVSAQLPRHRSVRAMGWNPLVPHHRRAAFEAEARRVDSPGYRITESAPDGSMIPAAEAEEYVPVRHITPYAANESALGFNVRSETQRRVALERSRDSGEFAITAPIDLVQDDGARPGFLGFVPVYGDADPQTALERRAALRGYGVAVFQAETILTTALDGVDSPGIEVRILDVTEPIVQHLAGGAPGPRSDQGRPALESSVDLDVGGRDWRVIVGATPDYAGLRRTHVPAATLLAGLVISALITAFLLLLGRSVAERETMQQNLIERERRLRLTLEAVADGAWDWNLETGAVEFSDSWLAMLGYRRAEVEPHVRFWKDIVHPDDLDEVEQRLADHLDGRTDVYECENRLRHKDGEYRWNLDRGRVVERAPDGTPLRMVGTDTNITVRKLDERRKREFEERVHHTQKLETLGVLAGGIAHDFNNLLVAVMGAADIALKELSSDAPARRHLERIRTAGLRAAELTQQMLAYAGHGRLVVEPVDLSELVREMLSLLRASISKKAELCCELAAEAIVEGDMTQLRQVVMNLITNASDALELATGTIEVRTGVQEVDGATLASLHLGAERPPGRYAFVEVSDSGVGMADEVVQRMFDPFYSTKFQGRGLGLAAVVGIVSSHGGAIAISTGPGRGTKMRILLPSAPGPAPREVRYDESPSQWRSSGVALVVDDEESVREIAQELLESCGFRVLTAADGVAGVDLFRKHRHEVEVVILDMNMPRMGGAEAYRRIRRLRPDASVVFSSGFGEAESLRGLVIGERVSFVRKPYLASEFIECVRASVDPATPSTADDAERAAR